MSTTLPPLTIQTFLPPFNAYSDKGSTVTKALVDMFVSRASLRQVGGLIARNEAGTRCAVTGKECTSDIA